MTHDIYWPDTKVIKSHWNDFNVDLCRGQLSTEFQKLQVKASSGMKGAQVSQMRTYSKAVPGEWVK